MGKSKIQDLLVKVMEQKVPEKQKLVNIVADILDIEKDAVYRRLRGSVLFSMKEVVIIASMFNISIDEIITQTAIDEIRVKMKLPQDYEKRLKDPWQLEQEIRYLNELSKAPYSEIGAALSGIPITLYFNYPYLSKFYLMHYMYNQESTVTFNKVNSPLNTTTCQNLNKLYQNISYTYYIWDRKITRELIDDILYFRSIRFISQEDVEVLKNELHALFDNLEKLAESGCYPETGNKFELYILDSHIDITYAFLHSENLFVSLYISFILLSTFSEDKFTFKKVNEWVKHMKRGATLISASNEKERTIFFNEQHAIVNIL